jgi:ABC-type Fe3+ transport system permease subunit
MLPIGASCRRSWRQKQREAAPAVCVCVCVLCLCAWVCVCQTPFLYVTDWRQILATEAKKTEEEEKQHQRCVLYVLCVLSVLCGVCCFFLPVCLSVFLSFFLTRASSPLCNRLRVMMWYEQFKDRMRDRFVAGVESLLQ